MATAQETINLATLKLKVRGRGATLGSLGFADALADLNRLFNGLWGFGGSFPYRIVRAENAYDVCAEHPAVRVLALSGCRLVTLPKNPADGARVQVIDTALSAATSPITIARNGLLIGAAAADATVSTNGGIKTYMYRGDLGDWKLAADLAAGDELPVPNDFDIHLLLARRMTEYGQRLNAFDEEMANECERKLRARYCAPQLLRPDSAVSALGGASSYGDSLSTEDSQYWA